ncbi:IS110 family transposase [Sinomonas terrae]|uniref:IS110 family transposase n=1 Tax=Sinomonas terrae TaxID=2908838 RepID=A0ABS9U5A4_9MICC|nr:IS110 family transposase [Sinomonas terrae]MCH6469431.1 IS110 family transposase [Sinomonas terrae]MCH6471816.1 IS110 family transposase [Sinomonas terrae]MCH6471869.1 IS110 family transposase [Sinomonas terrae]
MTTVAQSRPFVIGVDTHARTHTLAVLRAATGEQLGCQQFPATAAGMRRAMDWAARRTGGDADTLWVIEGTGSYGAQLSGAVTDAGFEVVEAPRGYMRSRTTTGKSDPLDAAAIAAAALPLDEDRLRIPRQDDGARAALRVLVAAREQMTLERTAKVNALTALVRTVDLGLDARRPLSGTQITETAGWRARAEDIATATARTEAVRLAKRITALHTELKQNQGRITELLRASPAAALLEETGIGPVTAAVAYIVWSHLGRVRSEAAFAALAGVSPIPASSGNTVRHRLNRGGDRRLNRALHMAIITRMAHDPDTRAYAERRTAEGKTPREIRRCLKRYLARHLYRTLNALHQHPVTTAA